MSSRTWSGAGREFEFVDVIGNSHDWTERDGRTIRVSARRLHPYIRRVYDAFGPKRMFWGTDLSRLPCTHRQGVTLFTEEIPWLTTDDKAWIMGRGVCEWLGWKA
jgi:hypothetical protein